MHLFARARSSFGAQSLRDRLLIVGAVLVCVVAAIQILMFGFGRDQGIYAVVADGLLHGGMPYRDYWDFKPPGIFVVFALAQLLFGHHMMAARLFEVLALGALLIAFLELSRWYCGRRLPGLIGAALAWLIHAELEFWHSGQPESFGGVVTILALWATALPLGSARRRFITELGIGALFGVAFLLKPPLGGGAIVCAAYLGRRAKLSFRPRLEQWLPWFTLGFGSLIPIAVCALWFALRGAWPDLHWTLFEFTPGYTALGWDGQSPLGMFWYAIVEVMKKFSWVLPVGITLSLALPARHNREREGVLLFLGVALVQLAGVAMQGKFFQYHYGATLPLLAWVAGVGCYKAWLWARGYWSLAWVTALVALQVARLPVNDVPGSFWERTGERLAWLVGSGKYDDYDALEAQLYRAADTDLGMNRRVAERLQHLVGKDESVLIWGFEPSIYFLARRRPASRFIYDVAQRVSWEQERSRRELLQDIQKRPRIIVVQHYDVFPFVTGDTLDSAGALADFPELERIVDSEYRMEEKIQDFDLYVLSSTTVVSSHP